MILKQAKDVARRWVIEEAANRPGFCGAFFHGSSNWLPDEAGLAATSDLDVVIVSPDPPAKPGKFIHRDVLLDVSFLPSERLRSPERVLGDYHLAGSFRVASVISDPSGRLTRLQEAVARDFAECRWVRARCEHAKRHALAHLRSRDESAPFHDQVTAWLFAAGVTTHVLLVAGLRNPTVRRRYLAARALLADYGHLDLYETLLEVLGCARMTRARVERHLAELAGAFDAAAAVVNTPFVFAADISEVARPIAIDGCRELIEGGAHREAVFWLAATAARCQKVLDHDSPAELREWYRPGFRHLLGDLGIESVADIRRRGEAVEDGLPRIWDVAEAIMAANRGIDV